MVEPQFAHDGDIDVVWSLGDGDDGFGTMSFDHDGDNMVMNIACLIEDPLPLVAPSSLYLI